MKKSLIFTAVAASAFAAGSAYAGDGDTLAAVKARGELVCGVNSVLTGFGVRDEKGDFQGFDVTLCRVVAAAVLNDADKVRYIPTTGENRFTTLSSGEIDLLVRNSTWSLQRDTDLKLDFVAVNYYDGQGFMVKSDLGVSSAKELDGATVCIQTGTTTELNLADYFKANNMSYTPVNVLDDAEAIKKYMAGSCDAYTTDTSGLAAMRASTADPSDHVILPEIVSKEPLGPVVRHGDNNWGDIVRWSYYALLTAEEKGVTKANLAEVASTTKDPETQRLLGIGQNMGQHLGLDAEFAKRAIMVAGNYGEIFEAQIGSKTPIGLSRGLNALWTKGGLQYAPPFR